MSLLQTAPTCDPDDQWCVWVSELTGNDWLAQAADWLIAKPLALLVLLIIAFVARWLLHRMIDRVTNRAAEGLPTPMLKHKPGKDVPATVLSGRRVQRAQTMGSLLKSIASIVVFTITGITALAQLGFAVGPLIASAGIVGIALGFGAQSLVTDFLSGIFMIVEDQYGVGDVIDTGEAVGTVENVSLRVTQLRDPNGVTWYVRNGEIIRIGNRSQGWSTAIVDLSVAYDEDIERAKGIIQQVVDDLRGSSPWDEKILEPPATGVESMAGGVVTIRVIAKTVAQEHFSVQRELRERIKLAFDKAGVRSPAVLPAVPPYGGQA